MGHDDDDDDDDDAIKCVIRFDTSHSFQLSFFGRQAITTCPMSFTILV
jgi:hypothetical protein